MNCRLVKRKLSGKVILLISPEPWDGIFVSKHHYALELAKWKNIVLFLNPPTKLSQEIVVTETNSFLHIVNYRAPVRGLRLLPSFIRKWIERGFLKRLEKKVGYGINVIWNFENSRFYELDFAGKKLLKIYHQVDLNQNFHPIKAARSADIVFAVNDPIKEFLSRYNRRVYKLGHGFAQLIWNSEPNSPFAKWQKHFVASAINVTYVGNLDSFYLDHELLIALVMKYSNANFFLVGPYSNSNRLYHNLKDCHNVHFTGKIHYAEIRPFLNASDILILAYRVKDFPDQLASSHKVIEYLSSGKVVVSSFMQEYENLVDLIVMAKNSTNYLQVFDRVVTQLSHFNSPELVEQRQKIASNCTYEKQLSQIEERLSEHQLL